MFASALSPVGRLRASLHALADNARLRRLELAGSRLAQGLAAIGAAGMRRERV